MELNWKESVTITFPHLSTIRTFIAPKLDKRPKVNRTYYPRSINFATVKSSQAEFLKN